LQNLINPVLDRDQPDLSHGPGGVDGFPFGTITTIAAARTKPATTNGGSTWPDISGNLPDAPVNDLVPDPRNRTTLYTATDVGVFLSTDNGTTWTPPGTGLPLVPISDLEATDTGTTTTLTAATYGLGLYRLN
jgi:hypothetical protein